MGEWDMRLRTKALLGISTATFALISTTGHAQEAQSTTATAEVQSADTSGSTGQSALGGEIIVTAQRRSENIQNVGIAISAYSGDQLRGNRLLRPAIGRITGSSARVDTTGVSSRRSGDRRQ